MALKALGRFTEALASYDNALALKPDHPKAHNNRGNALQELRRPAEALAAYDRAIAVAPDYAEAHSNRGNTLRELERPDDALAAYDRAIAIIPDYAQAHSNRGNVLRDIGRLDNALIAYETAAAIAPDYVESHANKGHVLHDVGRLHDALASYDVAIAIAPDYVEAHANRGHVLHDLGQLDDALASYDAVIARWPDNGPAHTGRGLIRLLKGEFAQGWQDYEWRVERSPLLRGHHDTPLWTGGAFMGDQTLLVYGEQGLGDTIQFCRYLPLLSSRGAKVLFAPQRSLTSLMRPLQRYCSIVDTEAADLPGDMLCPLLSLPFVLNTTLDTIPAAVPYLSAVPERVARWAAELGREGFKVGICWQGSTGKADVGRSFPLAALNRIAAVPGVRLINVHKGAGLPQLDGLPAGMRVQRLDMDPDPSSEGHEFLDTAAVISLCDLVITVDTAVAHLAGALGARTWVALRKIPDWRWLLDRADSPWYPTLRLFRQTERGDWGPLFAQMESELRLLVHRGQSQA